MRWYFHINVIILLSIFGLKNELQAQTGALVSNVKFRLSDEKDKVIITYDLARRTNVPNFGVKVALSLDGVVLSEAKSLTGDLGPEVIPGFGKRIVWDVYNDLNELSGNLVVEVNASPNLPPCVPQRLGSAYAGLGGSVLSGAGLMVLGLQRRSQSQELYTVYESVLNPQDAVYRTMSRQAHYEEANKQHKSAQMMMAGGGIILLAGSTLMLRKINGIKRYNRDCAARGKTSFLFQSTSGGIACVWRF